MRQVILSCAVAAAVALAAASPALARGGGGGGGGGGGHGGGGGGGAHFSGGGRGGPMMGGGSFRSNAMVGSGGPRFNSANLNRGNARFDRGRFDGRVDRFARFDRNRFDHRFRFRRFRNTAFLLDFWRDGYYDYAYCPLVTVRYVRNGRVFYRAVRQCDY